MVLQTVLGKLTLVTIESTKCKAQNVNNRKKFLIARSIQLENGGFSPSTECKNLLYSLDMSSKMYKMNFLHKIDKKIDKMKFIK